MINTSSFIWRQSLLYIKEVVIYVTSSFAKLQWSRDNKKTFWSSSQTSTCPPVHNKQWKLHTSLVMLNVQQGCYEYQFSIFWFDSTGSAIRVYRFCSKRLLLIGFSSIILYYPYFNLPPS